jgi:SPP1 family predicted phage head-tail adaptor
MQIIPTHSGDMRYRLTIVSVGPGALNEMNETSPVNSNVARIWAKISAVSGTERFVNAQNTADVTHEIRCRYVPGLTHRNKLTMGNRTFDIVWVNDIENQHIELQILAHEVIL